MENVKRREAQNMHDAMIETMRTDALHDLYAGYVTPLDREILADMPLPSDMVDPFASQERKA